MTNTPTPTPTPTGPTQASASAPLPSPAPTAESRKVIKPKVTIKVPKTYSANITGPKHLFPNPIKVFVHNSDRTFRESPHFENTPHYTMENEADQNARSELKLPRIHTDNTGNIHVVSSTGKHLSFPEVKEALESHLLKDKFKNNPYLQNNQPLEAHQRSVNGVMNRLNKMYGTSLEHDANSHRELATKLHEIGKKMSAAGRPFKEIKRAQGDAIHEDYINGLFESHGFKGAKTLKVNTRKIDPKTNKAINVEKEIPIEHLKQILIQGNPGGYQGDIETIRKNIIQSLKRNQPKPSMWQDIKDGAKQAVSEFGSDVSSVLQTPAKGVGNVFGGKSKVTPPPLPSRKTRSEKLLRPDPHAHFNRFLTAYERKLSSWPEDQKPRMTREQLVKIYKEKHPDKPVPKETKTSYVHLQKYIDGLKGPMRKSNKGVPDKHILVKILRKYRGDHPNKPVPPQLEKLLKANTPPPLPPT